jgi:hypothetical protein
LNTRILPRLKKARRSDDEIRDFERKLAKYARSRPKVGPAKGVVNNQNVKAAQQKSLKHTDKKATTVSLETMGNKKKKAFNSFLEIKTPFTGNN